MPFSFIFGHHTIARKEQSPVYHSTSLQHETHVPLVIHVHGRRDVPSGRVDVERRNGKFRQIYAIQHGRFAIGMENLRRTVAVDDERIPVSETDIRQIAEDNTSAPR